MVEKNIVILGKFDKDERYSIVKINNQLFALFELKEDGTYKEKYECTEFGPGLYGIGKKINKKANMAYWDEIDNISEEFVREFLNCATTKLNLDDDAIMEIGKAVAEKILDELKERKIDTDKAYPYVNENY